MERAETGAVLRFRNVTVRYDVDRAPALDGCSLAVGEGERVALIGANGSGKTTILMAAVGLISYEGIIEVAGIRLNPAEPEPVRERVGMMFSIPDDQLLFPRVLDDVAFTLRRRGVAEAEAEARSLEALARLQAEHLAEASPYQLSRGERARVALAGTLVAQPSLLLLDEPSSGLDPPGRRLLAEHLADLPSAMLIATHDIQFAADFCHRYIVLESGRVRTTGSDYQQISL